MERLTSRYERDMSVKKKSEDSKVLTVKMNQEKQSLERNMTVRRDKKKENLTKKLLEHERYNKNSRQEICRNYVARRLFMATLIFISTWPNKHVKVFFFQKIKHIKPLAKGFY